jgi:phage antirepressor YoqD-like protein
MQPDVDAIGRLRATPGSVPLTTAAKDLKMKPMAFCDWLSDMGWLFWRTHPKGRRRVAYQPIIDKGWLSHGPAAIVGHSDGSRERVSAVHVTSEGMVKLAKILEKQKADIERQFNDAKQNQLRSLQSDEEIINEIRHDDSVYGHGED